MKYIIGLDQGSSKTDALVLDELGKIHGMGKSYGACHSSDGMEYAMSAVKNAVLQAMTQSGIEIADVSIISAGMTGVDWDFEEKLLHDALKLAFPIDRIKVVNDCIIAMRAETDKDFGCILCAGSGLNCAVKNGRNSQIVFGYFVDEECAGGISLGKKAIKVVTDSYVGLRPDTVLTKMLLEYFEVKTVEDLLYKKVTGAISLKEYLYLPILLEQAAMQNDQVTLSLLADYGKSIAWYVVCGLKKLSMLDSEVTVVLSGSIFKCKAPILKESVVYTIHKHAIHARIVDAVYEPIVGAALFGLDELHGTVSSKVSDNLKKSADKFQLKRMN